MRYQIILSCLLAAHWSFDAQASRSESEANSTVEGVSLRCTNTVSTKDDPPREICVEQVVEEVGDNTDPSLANPLPLNEQMVGQLYGTRDYDWFYLDASSTYSQEHPITPVYFGCDQELGHYYESLTPIDAQVLKDSVAFRVNYYYAPPGGTTNTAKLQSSYLVYPVSCKYGTAETIGHMRFQMNTEKPGRYYVRVWGNLISNNAKLEETISIDLETTVKRVTLFDQIVTPTADYGLWVYTNHLPGTQEPNDGKLEAYPLVSGTPVTGQLSTMYDQDWFYIDNDPAVNFSKKIAFNFTCTAQSGVYILSVYDSLGVLQASYQVPVEQCGQTNGFSFSINANTTSSTARYYFVVAPPTYTDTTSFSHDDYTVTAVADSPVAVEKTVDLSATVSASPASVKIGSNVTVTITTTNNGSNTATNVHASLSLPQGLEFSSGSGCVPLSSGTSVDCSLGNLVSGDTASRYLVLIPTELGEKKLTVLASSNQSDPNPANNKATAATTVTSGTVDLQLSLSADPADQVVSGKELVYKAVVVNKSPLTKATNTKVTFTLPSNVQLLATDSTCAGSNATVVCDLGTLAFQGGTALRFVHVSPTAAGTSIASASATAVEADANPADNQATLTTTVLPQTTASVTTTPAANETATPAITPAVEVLSPNGGETWQARNRATIQWNLSDSLSHRKVNIRLSTDGGASWKTLKSNAKNTGSWSWKVGRAYVTDRALLKVCAAKVSPALCDASDGEFSIAR
jgi:uncharacterized repeat protein (TIGR01451 family)